MKNRYLTIIFIAMLVALMSACTSTDKIKTLIITGQGVDNLVWMTRSQAVQSILDDAGLFSTKIVITPPAGQDMSKFNPNFSNYDLVVIDFEGDAWPEKTVAALKQFVNEGGGVVRIHSKRDNGKPFPPSLSVSERHDFEVHMNVKDNPIINGLPVRWLHPKDVIVQGMPLNGDSIQVLATAFSDTKFAGSGIPEPVLLTST
ncbi:MAG: ThuA domain-containing protein, partial [Bacteroidia bacterium]|nr:ThuA domain-containing protein [Bacteroidia bacterium]